MHTLLVPGIVAILLLLAAAPAAGPVPDVTDAGIVIRDDRPDARYRALGEKFPAVGRIGRRGDGTLIAPRWVLTAGHVASGAERPDIQVHLGGRAHAIARAVVHPEWREMGPHDIGLIELKEPVSGVAPVALYERSDEAGQTAILVGHGDTRTGRGGDWIRDGLVRGATSLVESAEGGRLTFRFRPPPAAGDLEGAPGRGDSGGPALLERDGTVFVAGVSSAGYDGEHGPGTYGAVDHFTRVSAYIKWIRGIVR
jgi:hypothetical protein